MIIETKNLNEITTVEIPDSTDTFVTGLSTDDYNIEELESEETIAAITSMHSQRLEEAAHPKLNRAQRRALMKKMGKAGRGQVSTISDTARKLNYIDLVQKLRELNKKKENENYETDSDENN